MHPDKNLDDLCDEARHWKKDLQFSFLENELEAKSVFQEISNSDNEIQNERFKSKRQVLIRDCTSTRRS